MVVLSEPSVVLVEPLESAEVVVASPSPDSSAVSPNGVAGVPPAVIVGGGGGWGQVGDCHARRPTQRHGLLLFYRADLDHGLGGGGVLQVDDGDQVGCGEPFLQLGQTSQDGGLVRSHGGA